MKKPQCLYILIITILMVKICGSKQSLYGKQLKNVESLSLTENQFNFLSTLNDTDHFRNVLEEILIPRVVGTPGHDEVRNFIVKSLQDLEWTVEVDAFEDVAPIKGKLKFENVIATLNPNAERFLVLACHYDSKFMPGIEFVGATDSAVPCAMLLNTAFVLKEQLEKIRNHNLSIKLVFFDGEEAFKNWSPKDSIYGARHLAKKWKNENIIPKIELLVLLDLLGASDPEFYSFFPQTEASYSKLVTIENLLAKKRLLQHYTTSGIIEHKSNGYFHSLAINNKNFQVEDDHLPFLKLNVPVVHMIPLPFPNVWHTADDDIDHVDFHTTENLCRIIRLFILDYILAPKK